ncbi:hypothetical protein [Candidatus Chromulinivorax destructor]|uniref:Uncharacterized protein n=1 Tax=Candidatus Chromulinivorax destructor TaxID=2066483 RepID=A0A345ZCS6_9BACT|nr:hypothetical protein [Candidatus Chromulinivorax destructor]AXK61093.1 hypothetical protein C0J27_05170 [Candidatus Chromulinivorax destructor]
MKNVIKKIAMLSMLVSIAGNTSLLMSSQINDKQKVQLENLANYLSKEFATLAQDAQLSDALKTEYKDVTAAVTNFLASLKTGATYDNDKKLSLSNQLEAFYKHLMNDSQYQQYSKSNQAIVSNLSRLVYFVDREFNEIKKSSDCKN